MRGILVRLPEGKNFGFIRSGNVDFFFHRQHFDGFWEDLVGDFKERQIEMEFQNVPSPKGPRAENVRRTDFPN